MARVHIAEDVQNFPMNYVFSTYAPRLSAAAGAYSRAVYEHTALSVREMEGARYRSAQINGCIVCEAARASADFDTHMPGNSMPLERPMRLRGEFPTEAFYKEVENWLTSDIFSPRERPAIEFAERMGERPKSFEGDEAFWSQVKEQFSDDEIVDLTLAIGSWIALGRATHILELDGACVLPSAMAA